MKQLESCLMLFFGVNLLISYEHARSSHMHDKVKDSYIFPNKTGQWRIWQSFSYTFRKWIFSESSLYEIKQKGRNSASTTLPLSPAIDGHGVVQGWSYLSRISKWLLVAIDNWTLQEAKAALILLTILK